MIYKIVMFECKKKSVRKIIVMSSCNIVYVYSDWKHKYQIYLLSSLLVKIYHCFVVKFKFFGLGKIC